jgi:uncharacterized membrane protein
MSEKIIEFFAFLPREIYVFLISLLPIIELRGAIPVGAAIGLPFYVNYPIAVLGNLLPVPFILAFIPFVLDFMHRHRIFPKLVEWIWEKAKKNRHKIIRNSNLQSSNDGGEETQISEFVTRSGENAAVVKSEKLSRGVFIALMIFVAVPLPGTGAWTGSLVASLFGLPKRSSFLAVMLGVLISGAVMCLASYGVIGFLYLL